MPATKRHRPIPFEPRDYYAEMMRDALDKQNRKADTPWLTLEEAAAYIRMSPSTLYKNKTIPRYGKKGAKKKFLKSDLDQHLKEQR